MQGTIMDEGSRTAGPGAEAIAEALVGRIGPQKYKIWFQSCARFTLAEGSLKIGVPNPFMANWLESHFLRDIQAAAHAATGSHPTVSFVIESELSEKRARPAVETAAAAQAHPRKVVEAASGPSSKALRLSLDTFIVGPSNELAYSAARAVVREQHSPFNPLFIHGGYGVGKTHLLQGICNGVAEARPQTNWLYLSAEEFANQFVLALKTKKLEAFRARLRKTDLLAIDDVHFLASKPSTQEEFLHTFNTINLAGKQVVLVSDAHPKMIGQLSEKLVNRFVSGMVVKIDPPDFQTRCEICRQFAQRMMAGAFGDSKAAQAERMSEGVVRFVAERVRSNVRELEGALLKLVAYAALQNEKITLAMAQSVLAEHIERCDPIVHVCDIESTVAAYFGTTAAMLHSAKKDRTVSLARHFSMYLIRKHTKMSSSEIGRAMGNKNHATVLVACKKVEDLLRCNEDVHWQGPHGNKVVKARTVLADLEDGIAR
ncbi:MAG TPA: chromosomal replication initiator protein DnaA [Sedimentisphaerales bacterium]|nr:chromosomal replication initiator protein DnaA [Sedimentisphaerales bacterium]HRV48051.1 chromosomal replication initiator protein DnaA [Sedimentisphaerales bacterium]